MEQQLKERLVGAAVLVVLTVIFVPMVLDGPELPSATAPATIAPVPVDASTFGYDLSAPMPGAPATTPAAAPATVAAAPAASKPAAAKPAVTTTATSAAPKPAPAMPQTNTAATSAAPKPAATPSAPAATSSAGTGWAAQVGSFSKETTAKTIAADLKRRGFKAFVMEHREAGKTLYRVRVGPVASREAADALGRKITQQTGQAARPVRHP